MQRSEIAVIGNGSSGIQLVTALQHSKAFFLFSFLEWCITKLINSQVLSS